MTIDVGIAKAFKQPYLLSAVSSNHHHRLNKLYDCMCSRPEDGLMPTGRKSSTQT